VSTVEARRRSLAGQSHLDPVVHRASRGSTSPTTSSYVPLRDPYTLQRLSHSTKPTHHRVGTPGPATLDVANWAHSPLTRRESELRYERYMWTIRQTNGPLSLLQTSVAGRRFFLPFSFQRDFLLGLGLSGRRGKQIMTIARNVSIRTENGRHSYERTIKSFIC